MTGAFPETMDFSGYNAPSRVECDVRDLEVEGRIPDEVRGSWFRSIPDPQYPPMLGDDTYLSGDGMVSLFRFADGHVDLRMRYVETERLKNDRAARRSLHGLYRNPYTDDPSVRGKDRTAANTTPVWHAGRLLATKEDGRPYEVDPHTLETRGQWSYGGRLRSETMTAHVRIDPETREMFFFGYEAGGLGTRDVAYCIADAAGELVKEEWFEAPYVSMMHDFVVTKEHAIFPVFPTTASLERIKAGGPHWVWEPGTDTHIGIMPRYGSVTDLRWFRGPARSAYHFMNGFSADGKVHIDFGVGMVNPFPFIQKASNVRVTPEDMVRGGLVRWTFDLDHPGETYEERVIAGGGDFPIIAAKDHMRDYEVGYYQVFDPAAGPPLIVGPVGAGFNTIRRVEVKTGAVTSLNLGPQATVQEHVHIPSRQAAHEGYLAFVVDHHDTMLSEVAVVEAASLEKGPIARVKIPFRLRCQVHGTWVSAVELPF